jgi:hypothetical protein
VVAGGYVVENNAGDMVVNQLYMDAEQNAWTISATNIGGAARDASAFAVCISNS